ncbi:immunoglobulin E-set [Geranomyces variabilis]|nr:immunoglobulin E-set [Geranomyces variabilis]KAJ3134589.1 Beta subunit 1 of SnRK1 [Geranomyces variabilis]
MPSDNSPSHSTLRRAPPTFIAMPPARRINTIQLFTFRWHHAAAKTVILTGTFDKWQQSIVVPRDPHCADEFSITLALDRLVRHEFKFVVDGQWRCSHAFPTAFDNNGCVNNVIESLGPEELAALAFGNNQSQIHHHHPAKRRAGAAGMMDFDYLVGRSLAGIAGLGIGAAGGGGGDAWAATAAAKRSRVAY